MPNVQTTLDFLANLPLCRFEKPFFVLPLVGSGLNPEKDVLNNLRYETKPVVISDMRGKGFNLSENGFQLMKPASNTLNTKEIKSRKPERQERKRCL